MLVLHWEQLWPLFLLETLTQFLIFLGEIPTRQQHVQFLVGVINLCGQDVTSVLVQLHVYTSRLLLPDFVVQLALAVVDESVVWKLVVVEARGQVLLPECLANWVLMLRHCVQLVVQWFARLVVLEVETWPGSVVERRRLSRVLVVIVP